MQFNPEDSNNFGPHCRNCHKGSSDCGACHDQLGAGLSANDWPKKAWMPASNTLVDDPQAKGLKTAGDTGLVPAQTVYGDNDLNGATDGPVRVFAGAASGGEDYWKHERTVAWATDWRTNPAIIDSTCSNDGFSWPHRTMGFKLLKDEMWGLDFDGTLVSVGETRDGLPDYISADGSLQAMTAGDLPSNLYNQKAQDLDSACLDCHNPNIWNVVDMADTTDLNNYKDRTTTSVDDANNELLLRGLP